MIMTSSQRAQQIIELITGFLVLVIFATMVVWAIIGNGRKSESGYYLNASFGHIDGLGIGSDIRLAGVAIGQVVKENVDPKTYKAMVTFTVRPDIKLPTDTSAIITSDSLLGGKYIALSPGGDEKLLQSNATIVHTQGSIGLQELLSKFIFTVTDSLSKTNQNKASPSLNEGAN